MSVSSKIEAIRANGTVLTWEFENTSFEATKKFVEAVTENDAIVHVRVVLNIRGKDHG